jgi:hypothetical protein
MELRRVGEGMGKGLGGERGTLEEWKRNPRKWVVVGGGERRERFSELGVINPVYVMKLGGY